MENPEQDIVPIIHSLTQDAPAQQQATIETYFSPTASFTHPFCRTGSFANSRWLILEIYRWYKIISPHIEISIDSVAFDERKLLLYVGIRQNFRLWFVPAYLADVALVTVLQLTTDPYPHVHDRTTKDEIDGLTPSSSASASSSSSSYEDRLGRRSDTKYWIQSQNDLYQTSEWIKFVVPWGIGWRLVVVWHFIATFFCVLGAFILSPFTPLLDHVFGGSNTEKPKKRKLSGLD